jgi:hypothetical protein
LGDVQSSYRDALLTNKERAIDEKARQFDMMLGINQQKADAATTTAKAAGVSAGARADQTALNEKVEFGTGTADNPSPGSKAAGRAGLEDYRSARAALANMQIEALQQKLTGMLPEQIDGRKRTAILQAAQDLKTMQFKVNSVTSARNLGIGLIRALRNPVTGSFNDKDTAAAVNALAHDLFGSLQQVNEIYAAEFLEAFNEAGTKESGIKKDSGPSMTDDQRLQRAKDVMNALREKRRKELEGQAPDPTGR